MANLSFPEMPAPFMTVRCHDLSAQPSLSGLCVGYEQDEWRGKQFVDHMFRWLPEFALTLSECRSLTTGNAVELLEKAARIVYETKKFENRGEFGELFLHAAVRQVFSSVPAISKIYYKTTLNETVKGFDAVHVVGPADNLELWLGEVKFQKDIGDAIQKVAKEIEEHLVADYLRNEFILIGNKLDQSWEHTPVLKRLLAQETSLDQVFARACIPVLLTYDSDCIGGFSRCCEKYEAAFEKELSGIKERFAKKMKKMSIPQDVRIHLFLLPLKSKPDLVTLLDAKLRAWQNI